MSVLSKIMTINENVPRVYKTGYDKGVLAGAASVSKDVNFYDYDGTLLHSYSVEEVQALKELPELPSHAGLICQGWNYDLATMKIYNRAMDVGATYITDDGKTRLHIRIADEGRMTVPLVFWQTKDNGVIVDWGDGSDTETFSGTSAKETSHTYANIGDYTITLEVADGELAFGKYSAYYCIMGNSNDTYSDPNGVYRNMLQKVEIGAGVTSVNDHSFNKCRALTSITIPNNVTKFGGTAFSECPLTFVVVPKSATSISSTFWNCAHLKKVILPDGLTQLQDDVFNHCQSLTSVIIPKSVTTIRDNVFDSCYSLTSINIPENVTSIGTGVFSYCYAIDSINIPESVTSLGSSGFSRCFELASINLPDNIEAIPDSFLQNTNITVIDIPDAVTNIGSYAFMNCKYLSSINIPEGVTSLGTSAFSGCFSLKQIEIPDGITVLNSGVFSSCKSLVYIRIPKNLVAISADAFARCYGMSVYDFTHCISVPSLANTSAFTDIKYAPNCQIRVPAALYDEWIAATNWSTYADYIVAV